MFCKECDKPKKYLNGRATRHFRWQVIGHFHQSQCKICKDDNYMFLKIVFGFLAWKNSKIKASYTLKILFLKRKY